MYLSNEELIKQYKENHNFLLNRYLNGCDYLKTHKNQVEKWLPELLNVLDNINTNLTELMKLTEITSKEILEGFELRSTDEQ